VGHGNRKHKSRIKKYYRPTGGASAVFFAKNQKERGCRDEAEVLELDTE